MPWYAPGPGQWPHWAAADSALEHSFQSMGWVETDGTIPTPGVPPDPAAARLVKSINGKNADTTGGITLTQADLGGGNARTVSGPTLPTLTPGTEYIWNKTDGTGNLLDILTGVA